MLRQYIKFFINGGLLGIVAWGLQLGIYRLIDGEFQYGYAMASCLTFMPLIVVNFLIQKNFIFKKHGLFLKFFVANLSIMLLVMLLSEICKYFLTQELGKMWGERGGFLVASLLGSVPSFLLKKYWVFRG